MGEISGIEIEADLAGFGPVDPGLEMSGFELIAIDFRGGGLGIRGVKIEAMAARNQRERFIRIGAQFIGRAGLAGIVARDREPAAEAVLLDVLGGLTSNDECGPRPLPSPAPHQRRRGVLSPNESIVAVKNST
jgi:hypothetical protein